MTLQRVTQEDTGEYRCEISAPLDSVSLGETNVTLKVLGTSERESMMKKKKVSLKIGLLFFFQVLLMFL